MKVFKKILYPLVTTENGFSAVDARVLLKAPDKTSPLHLVISPYPNQYEEHITANTVSNMRKEGFRLDMIQIAIHPLLTPAPAVRPIIIAAHKVLAKLGSTRIEPVAIERAA